MVMCFLLPIEPGAIAIAVAVAVAVVVVVVIATVSQVASKRASERAKMDGWMVLVHGCYWRKQN